MGHLLASSNIKTISIMSFFFFPLSLPPILPSSLLPSLKLFGKQYPISERNAMQYDPEEECFRSTFYFMQIIHRILNSPVCFILRVDFNLPGEGRSRLDFSGSPLICEFCLVQFENKADGELHQCFCGMGAFISKHIKQCTLKIFQKCGYAL